MQIGPMTWCRIASRERLQSRISFSLEPTCALGFSRSCITICQRCQAFISSGNPDQPRRRTIFNCRGQRYSDLGAEGPGSCNRQLASRAATSRSPRWIGRYGLRGGGQYPEGAGRYGSIATLARARAAQAVDRHQRECGGQSRPGSDRIASPEAHAAAPSSVRRSLNGFAGRYVEGNVLTGIALAGAYVLGPTAELLRPGQDVRARVFFFTRSAPPQYIKPVPVTQ